MKLVQMLVSSIAVSYNAKVVYESFLTVLNENKMRKILEELFRKGAQTGVEQQKGRLSFPEAQTFAEQAVNFAEQEVKKFHKPPGRSELLIDFISENVNDPARWINNYEERLKKLDVILKSINCC